MQPARVVSAVEIDETVGARWWSCGPAVVYDGLGLESESEPIELWHTCLSCREKAVRFDVREVLAAGSEMAGADGAPWVLQLAEAFGLETANPLDRRAISTSRGDTPHLLRSDCTRCGARHGAVLGYGEHQPARYVATLEGAALVEPIPEDPTSGDAAPTVGVVVAVLAVLAMVGLVVWFNWSAVSDLRLVALLERSGVVTEATVTAERESHGPRSPDQSG